MADRFYGYQYGTNPRKINAEYEVHKSRYPKKARPVETTINSRTNNTNVREANSRTNRVQSKIHEKNVPEFGRKQVKTNEKHNNINDVATRKHKQENIRRVDSNATKISRRKNVQSVRVTKESVIAKLKIVMSLLAGFSILFAISYQNALINESFNRKETYRKEVEALSKTNQQIEISIENNLNLNYIEQVAKEKLGMQKLSNEQKIYVSLPKEDYVAPATEQIVMEENLSFFEKIIRLFKK